MVNSPLIRKASFLRGGGIGGVPLGSHEIMNTQRLVVVLRVKSFFMFVVNPVAEGCSTLQKSYRRLLRANKR